MKHKEEETHKNQSLCGCIVVSCGVDHRDGNLELFSVAVEHAVEEKEGNDSEGYSDQDASFTWMLAVLVQAVTDAEDHADFHTNDRDLTHEFGLSRHQVNIPNVHCNY